MKSNPRSNILKKLRTVEALFNPAAVIGTLLSSLVLLELYYFLKILSKIFSSITLRIYWNPSVPVQVTL